MRKRIIIAALLAAMLLTLAACGGTTRVDVWRPLSEYYLSGGAAVEVESVKVDGSLGEIDATVAAFNTSPGDNRFTRALPDGVDVLGWTLEGGELRLDVSAEYASLSGWRRSIADCCAILTFCAIEGVDTVSIYSGDTMLSDARGLDSLVLEDSAGVE